MNRGSCLDLVKSIQYHMPITRVAAKFCSAVIDFVIGALIYWQPKDAVVCLERVRSLMEVYLAVA